jgi:hypothetical protein
MKDNILINKLFNTYRKYSVFIIDDEHISSELIIPEKEEPVSPVDREKERKFLLLLEKNFNKYSFEF